MLISMPKIMYGTAWKKDLTADLVVRAVKAGFRGIDTANQPKHYNEPGVGDGLKQLYEHHGIVREELFVQTKFSSIGDQDTSKPLPYDSNASLKTQVKTSLNSSLANLQTTYLDSYVLHSPLPKLSETVEVWKTMVELRDQGKIRMIGISNCYDVATLIELEKVSPVDVVQNRWYERNGWDQAVVTYCLKEGIEYQSFWTLSGSPNLLKHVDILTVAKVKQCKPAQAVYALAMSRGITVLAGSQNDAHMKDGVEAERIDLSDSDLINLNSKVFSSSDDADI